MSRGLLSRCRPVACGARVVRQCSISAAILALAACGTVQVSSDLTADVLPSRGRPQTNAEYERAQLLALGCATPLGGSRGSTLSPEARRRSDTVRMQRTAESGPDIWRGVLPPSVQTPATATTSSSSVSPPPAGGEIRNVQRIGSSYIGPGGQTSTRIGGVMFNSDGTSGTLIGNTIFNR